MNENSETVYDKGKKTILTTKRIIRILSLLCIAFVFCPMFMVSCSGQEMKVDVMTAVGGISLYGEPVVEPNPVMLLCLLIPIAVILLLFVRKNHTKRFAWCAMAGFVVDFGIWIIFKITVERIAAENYCVCKTMGWYYCNMVVIAFCILITLAVSVGFFRWDGLYGLKAKKSE